MTAGPRPKVVVVEVAVDLTELRQAIFFVESLYHIGTLKSCGAADAHTHAGWTMQALQKLEQKIKEAVRENEKGPEGEESESGT